MGEGGMQGEPIPTADLPPLPSEQFLIDLLEEKSLVSRTADARRILTTSLGRAQLSHAVSQKRVTSETICHFFDLYRADLARRWHSRLGDSPRFEILCQADFPAGPFDLVLLPLTSQGDGELTREMLQQAHESLAVGGMLLASSDNRTDTWLGEQFDRLFDSVRRRCGEGAVAYEGIKTKPLAKRKNYACEFAFRDRGRLIRAWSRPGVFSHRRIDPGARRLLDAIEIQPGAKVLDLGCGAGTVAVAAALRHPGAVSVTALDSHARAVECTVRTAEANGCQESISVHHSWLETPPRIVCSGPSPLQPVCSGPSPLQPAPSFTLAAANPPYYGNFAIAERFLNFAHAALERGGEIVVVTQSPEWYAQRMPEMFHSVSLEESRGYWIAKGNR